MDQQEQNIPTAHKFNLASNLPLAVLVAAAMVSGSILYVGSGGKAATIAANPGTAQAQQSDAPVKVDPSKLFSAADASIGDSNAKVTIVEFSDFQCPFCRSFYNDTFLQLKKDYIDSGKVRFIYRYYPLPFHDMAQTSALAAACAAEQNKFWEFHDKIFSEQDKKGTGTVEYTAADIKSWAAQIGVNASQFNSCLDSKKYASKVDGDTTAGSGFGVSGTPSFFINGQLLVGAQPYAQFKALIDAQL